MRYAAAIIDETDLTSTGVRARVDGQTPHVAVSELQRDRAKHLPLHLANVRPDAEDARVDATAEQVQVVRLRSSARIQARAKVARLLDAILVCASVSNGDLAAALDLSADRVRKMRSGEAPFEVAHVLLAASRLPKVRDPLVDLFALIVARSA